MSTTCVSNIVQTNHKHSGIVSQTNIVLPLHLNMEQTKDKHDGVIFDASSQPLQAAAASHPLPLVHMLVANLSRVIPTSCLRVSKAQ
jgi:hypothetical protein